MNTELINTDRRRGGHRLVERRISNIESSRAFSLIELVGVLTVIAFLAAFMVPTLIRQMDRIAGEQESAALKSLGDALQQSILRKRYIPSASDWATNIASELGMDVAKVTTSPRQRARFFLIDPSFRVGNNSSGLPYDQTSTNWLFGSVVTNNAGIVVPPQSPRLLILSSIGRALPTNIVSGTSTDFGAIWDWNDKGDVVPATTYGWPGWPDGDDLKVQRVHLAPLFLHLVLTANNSSTNATEAGHYRIDSGSTNNVPSPGLGRDGYFLKNSLLSLYAGRTNFDSQQILAVDTSFVYEQNVWRSSLTGGSFLAGSLDLSSVVDKFLESPENTNAMFTLTNNAHGNTSVSIKQQSLVVSNMIAYMTAYTNWAASNFTDDNRRQIARDIRDAMMSAVAGQYDGDYLPYPTACQP